MRLHYLIWEPSRAVPSFHIPFFRSQVGKVNISAWKMGALTVSASIRSTSGGREIKLGLSSTSDFKFSLPAKVVVTSERAIAHGKGFNGML